MKFSLQYVGDWLDLDIISRQSDDNNNSKLYN
jgi:hypothetical protein